MPQPRFRAVLFILILAMMTFSKPSLSDQNSNDESLTLKIDTFLKRDVGAFDARYSPLKQVKNFSMPPEVSSVRQAMAFVLVGSGYSLNANNLQQPENLQIVSSPVPHIQRSMTDISVIEALKVLIGQHHNVAIDPISREIGFALNSQVKQLHNVNRGS